MLRRQQHRDTATVECALDERGDLLPEFFLNLESSGEALHRAGQFRQTRQPGIWEHADLGRPEERQHMVRAQQAGPSLGRVRHYPAPGTHRALGRRRVRLGAADVSGGGSSSSAVMTPSTVPCTCHNGSPLG